MLKINKMERATAKAPANIAFIKYWGKVNEKLRLPANSSISMNLSGAFTVTSVEFNDALKKDSFVLNNIEASSLETLRVTEHLNRIRTLAKIKSCARVISKNNFPKSSGIASSASGFAALTLAASKAIGLNLSEKDLSILARLGSGSACRSIPDGFVEWRKGENSDTSYAHSIYPKDYWDIEDIIVIVGSKGKKLSSSEGHALVESSPFYNKRIIDIPKKVKDLKKSLREKDFTKFGEIVEEEAINMHAVMMTSSPPLFYWQPETISIILSIIELRNQGLEAYFTIDAGPNVHIIIQRKDLKKLKIFLSKMKGVVEIIENNPAVGARIVVK
jgi:diphosphomevalonate decarboxylase